MAYVCKIEDHFKGEWPDDGECPVCSAKVLDEFKPEPKVEEEKVEPKV